MIERQKDESIEGYLSRILLALARQAGGKLVVKRDTFEIDTSQMLTFDVDSATGDLLIMALSRYAEAIKVHPRAGAWTIPFEERAAALGMTGSRHRIPTDEELAEAERARNVRRNVRTVAPPVSAVPDR